MRGFCHRAGAEPEPNVDCGVLESDKTKHTQLTAPNLRPDHSQTPSTLLPPRPHSLTAWVMIKSRERERESLSASLRHALALHFPSAHGCRHSHPL